MISHPVQFHYMLLCFHEYFIHPHSPFKKMKCIQHTFPLLSPELWKNELPNYLCTPFKSEDSVSFSGIPSKIVGHARSYDFNYLCLSTSFATNNGKEFFSVEKLSALSFICLLNGSFNAQFQFRHR